MNPYVTTERTIATVSIGLATGAAKGLEAWLSGGSKTLATAILVLAIPMFTVFIKGITTRLFNDSRLLRRFVWGKFDIEGCWLDCIRTDSNIVSFGITEFFVKDFVLNWRGQNFSADGIPTSAYEAVAVSVDWPINKFWYATHPSEERSKQDEGICELTFAAPDGKAPRVYFGWSCDTGSNQVYSLRGKRLRDNEILRALSDPESQLRTLLEQVADLRAMLPPADPRRPTNP